MTDRGVRRGVSLVMLALALGVAACGDRGPRATPLPPGADATVVATPTPAGSAPVDGGATASTAGDGAAPSAAGSAEATGAGQADRDLDRIDADLRRLDDDLSNSRIQDEGAVR